MASLVRKKLQITNNGTNWKRSFSMVYEVPQLMKSRTIHSIGLPRCPCQPIVYLLLQLSWSPRHTRIPGPSANGKFINSRKAVTCKNPCELKVSWKSVPRIYSTLECQMIARAFMYSEKQALRGSKTWNLVPLHFKFACKIDPMRSVYVNTRIFKVSWTYPLKGTGRGIFLYIVYCISVQYMKQSLCFLLAFKRFLQPAHSGKFRPAWYSVLHFILKLVLLSSSERFNHLRAIAWILVKLNGSMMGRSTLENLKKSLCLWTWNLEAPGCFLKPVVNQLWTAANFFQVVKGTMFHW